MWPLRRRCDPRTAKSIAALKESTEALEAVKSRTNEVTEVATALRKFRTNNHFAEHITRIMSEGGGK
jgi:hypothetical protein